MRIHKNLRYLVLLLILLFVATSELLSKTRATSWEYTLWVRVYAVNGDGRAATDRYIDSLNTRSFDGVERFFNQQARRYGIEIDAIDLEYGGRLDSHPPQPPSGENIFENIWWSLRFRAWAWHRAWSSDSNDGDIELFVSYYDTATIQALRHSVGLEGGQIGLINAFADKSYAGSNQVVIAHEFMYTLGASDKYGPGNYPRHPEGFAEPDRIPLLPQRYAEIMGGRIPKSSTEIVMPASLREVLVGPLTALEINWIES